MPFLDHFGLNDYPFALTPNTQFYYPVPETERVMAALAFAVSRGDGFVKIVGEVGTGKTLLCRLLLASLRSQPVNMAYINAPVAIDAAHMPLLIAQEFGLKLKGVKADPISALRTYLLEQHSKGRRNVLVIDEAQALGVQGLEAVRLLSNLETETDKLLQIVLFGQAELDRLLHRTDMRQFLQRINFSFVTHPLSQDAVGDYLRHRIESCCQKVGRGKKKKTQNYVCFSSSATKLLAKASGGLPRLINVLADKALLAAYAQGVMCVDTVHVRAACRETQGLPFWPRWWVRWMARKFF
ncbi:MAG: AAA family ATPase [Alphaproteobacteria bacterium]|nr:AAA family ATPase [Alphaproteobacteria bacterium]